MINNLLSVTNQLFKNIDSERKRTLVKNSLRYTLGIYGTYREFYNAYLKKAYKDVDVEDLSDYMKRLSEIRNTPYMQYHVPNALSNKVYKEIKYKDAETITTYLDYSDLVHLKKKNETAHIPTEKEISGYIARVQGYCNDVVGNKLRVLSNYDVMFSYDDLMRSLHTHLVEIIYCYKDWNDGGEEKLINYLKNSAYNWAND